MAALKEKLLAAHRGGIKNVIIPVENVKDLKEVPDNIKQDLNIKPVRWIDEVLVLALNGYISRSPRTEKKVKGKAKSRLVGMGKKTRKSDRQRAH